MYHQEPVFRLRPEHVDDDRSAVNRHRLELPVWFYNRYPGALNLKEEVMGAIRAITPDFWLVHPHMVIDRMPTLAECASLQALAQSQDCCLEAVQRPQEEFDLLVRDARALRRGHP